MLTIMDEHQTAGFSTGPPLPGHPHTLATILRECIETDLSVIGAFIDIAEYWHQAGKFTDAVRASQQARKGIEAVHRCLSSTRSLTPELKRSLHVDCTGLQLRLMRIETKLVIDGWNSRLHSGSAANERP